MSTQPDYRNTDKNKWRHKWWKSAASRCRNLGIAPANAKVLYMPGPDDLDRRVAVKYGFLAHNLIGVDRDNNLCKELRKKNVTMIHGDAIDIVAAWKPDNLPDVILLDTCSMISAPFSRILSVFQAGNFMNKPMVWGINVIHGREKFLNSWREQLLTDLPPFGEVTYNPRRNLKCDVKLVHGGYEKKDQGNMHRGLTIAVMIAETFLDRPDIHSGYKNSYGVYKILRNMDMEIDDYKRPKKHEDDRPITMDSVIFNWSQRIIDKTYKLKTLPRITGYNKKTAHKIAAGLATGTMKNRA